MILRVEYSVREYETFQKTENTLAEIREKFIKAIDTSLAEIKIGKFYIANYGSGIPEIRQEFEIITDNIIIPNVDIDLEKEINKDDERYPDIKVAINVKDPGVLTTAMYTSVLNTGIRSLWKASTTQFPALISVDDDMINTIVQYSSLCPLTLVFEIAKSQIIESDLRKDGNHND